MAEESDRNLWDVFGVPNSSDLPSAQGIEQPPCANGAQEHDLENVHSLNPPGTSLPLKAAAGQKLVSIAAVSCTGDIPDESHRNGGEWIELSERHFFDSIAMEKSTNGNNDTSEHREEICNGASTNLASLSVSNGKTTSEEAPPVNDAEANGTEREPETAVNLENNDRTEAPDVQQERSIFEHINSNFLPLLESTKHDQTNGVLNGEGNVSGDSCVVEPAVSPNAICLPPKESQQNSGEPCGNRETDSNLFERVIVTASATDTSSQGQTSGNANPGFPFSEKLRRLTAWNKDNGNTMSNTVQPLRTGYDAVSAGCSFQHLAPLQLPPATPNTMATRFVNGQHQSLGIQVNKPTETSEVDANLVFESAPPLGYVNPTSNYVVRIQNGIPETVPRTVNTLTVSGGTGQTGSTVVINNPSIKANLRRLAPNTQFIRLKRVVIDPRGNLKERANGENVPTSMSTAQIVRPFIAPNPGPLNSYVTAVSPAQAFRSNGMGSAPFSHIQPAPTTLQGHSSNSRFQMVLPVLTPAGIVQPPAVNPLVMQSPAVVPINRTNLSGIIPSDLSCGERLLPSPELKERRFRPVSPPKRELPSDKSLRTRDARASSGIQGSSNAVRSSIRSLRTFLSNKVSSSDRRGSVEAELADQSYECALRESNSPDRERFLRCESSPVAVRLQSDSTCGRNSEKLIGYQSTAAALHEGERDRSDLSSISEEKVDDKSTPAVLSKGERNHLSTITEENIDDQSTPAALSECERKCYDLSTITEEKIDDHSTPAALSEGECERNDLSTIAEEKIDDQSTPATLSEAKRECNDIQMITEETSDVKLPDSPRTKDIEDADRASRKKQGNAMVRRLEPRLPSPVREHNSVGDLYRDPSQLTREERALQRAMMQFSVMEMKAKTEVPRTKHSIKRRLRKRSKLPAQTTVNKTHSGPKTWLKRIKRKRLFFSQRRRIAVKPEDPENNSSVKGTKVQQTQIIRRKRKLLPSADVKDGQPRIKRKCMETGKRDAIVPPADVQQTKATPLNHKSADIKPTKARRKSSEAFTQIQPKQEVVSEPTSGKGPQDVTSGKRPLHFALSRSDMKRRGVKRARVEIEPLHFETKEELQSTIEETAKVDRSHRVKTYMLVTSYQGFRDFKPVVLQSRTRRKSKPADEETPTTAEPPHEFPLLVVESVHSKPVKERVIAQNEEVQQLVENCLKARGKWHGNDAPGEEDANEDETLQDLRKLNVNRNTGETILHKAARLGYHETVRHHIHQGVDPNAKDNAGWTPLHEACSRGKVDVVKVLAKYGSDVNACSNDGIRPIHDAAEGGHVNVLRVLLSYGADPLLATYSGNTALRCAKETRTMAFLEGYLEDLGIRSSVPSVTEGEGCWEFSSSCSLIDDTTEHTGGIFDGIPDGDSIGDGEFEMCDRPHLPTYNLPVMASEELMCGRRNYVLMSDLLDHLRMSRAVLLKRCRRLDIREMPWSQFLAEIADRPLCVAPKFSPPDSSTQEGIAELVPLNYSVRKLLNIRVECVNLT